MENNFNNDLKKSLEVGFIDKELFKNLLYLPRLLTNNRDKNQKVLEVILDKLKICDEFYFSVAFLTTSGLAVLKNTLLELESKDIKGRILVSQYQDFTQPEALKNLKRFKNVDLRIATNNFHAKGYFFRFGNYYDLIIGSSNLTASALSVNKEWNLMVSATENSSIVEEVFKDAEKEFERAIEVDETFIKAYEEIYQKRKYKKIEENKEVDKLRKISPNKMQEEALGNLRKLRLEGKNKALLISATGTGKTYLSAFDAKNFNAKKLLFVVHRRNIAEAAMESYKNIFKGKVSMGFYSGNDKEHDKDFIFSTIQTISKDKNLEKFAKKHFDYIVIDETHRVSAKTYQKILNYFSPKFLLGMTATPERTDGNDIFKEFDHNIAYEIRLNRALEEEMLVPFHYYGISDLIIDNESIDKLSDFKILTSDDRVNHILKAIETYGTDDGETRGLIFCSRNEEAKKLSSKLNNLGLKTVSLSGENFEAERKDAIKKLEDNKLDYILTVDIFNEGIDIPKINQVIMLRPTQSAIIFIQQLGRGLRKVVGKDYLTVIDFIGNYQNNYLIPIALFGDRSYDKEKIRKLLINGSSYIPGSSSINFDKISKDRIFKALDNSNLKTKKDLIDDYKLLKFKLGYKPKMIDFLNYDSRNPKSYVDYSKSYYNFLYLIKEEKYKLNEDRKKILELFSENILDGKRIEEILVLKELIKNKQITKNKLESKLKEYKKELYELKITSILKNLNFEFITEKKNKKLKTVNEIYGFNTVKYENDIFKIENDFLEHLKVSKFKEYLLDTLYYSERVFNQNYNPNLERDGFQLYEKYSRKNILRILNWDLNEVGINIGGYKVNLDKGNCPIFINYHKATDISETTKYNDGFIDRTSFKWMSKSKRTLNSPDVSAIMSNKLRLPLFIRKGKKEEEFFYVGDLDAISENFHQTTIKDAKGKEFPIVEVFFIMKDVIDDKMYKYIIEA